MKILVIGSDGTIGRALVRYLRKTTFDVLALDNKSINYIDVTRRETFPDHADFIVNPDLNSPDLVFHLAGRVGRVWCEIDKNDTLESNIIGTMNVIDYCNKIGARLVYAGTSESYEFPGAGPAEQRLMDPVHEDQKFPTKFNGVYGIAKSVAELLIKQYSDDAVILRYFMCYGNEIPRSGFRSFICESIARALKGEEIYVHQASSRSWCYIDDIIDGSYFAAVNGVQGEMYNIGSNEEIPTIMLAHKIVELTDSDSDVISVDQPGNVYAHKRGDFGKMKELGWEATTSLNAGLLRTIDFMEKLK